MFYNWRVFCSTIGGNWSSRMKKPVRVKEIGEKKIQNRRDLGVKKKWNWSRRLGKNKAGRDRSSPTKTGGAWNHGIKRGRSEELRFENSSPNSILFVSTKWTQGQKTSTDIKNNMETRLAICIQFASSVVDVVHRWLSFSLSDFYNFLFWIWERWKETEVA